MKLEQISPSDDIEPHHYLLSSARIVTRKILQANQSSPLSGIMS